MRTAPRRQATVCCAVVLCRHWRKAGNVVASRRSAAAESSSQPLARVDRGSEVLRAVDLELRRLFVHTRVVNREIEHVLERPVQTRREHDERFLHQLRDK